MAVDFADGNGYVTTAWNTPVSTTYTSTGLKLIKIKVTFTDNTQMESYSQIDVKGVTSAFSTLTYPNRTPHFWRRFNEEPGVHSGGDISISYGITNDGILDRPLIVVEGYDASTVSEELADPFNYEVLITALTTGPFNFNDELDMAGYDLIFLNYNDGVDDIRRNAALFEDVVDWVNTNKVAGADDNVVLGISMGGLVARYGLADMTKNRGANSTQTRLLITHDSPHRGANVPLGFQHLFKTSFQWQLLSSGGKYQCVLGFSFNQLLRHFAAGI